MRWGNSIPTPFIWSRAHFSDQHLENEYKVAPWGLWVLLVVSAIFFIFLLCPGGSEPCSGEESSLEGLSPSSNSCQEFYSYAAKGRNCNSDLSCARESTLTLYVLYCKRKEREGMSCAVPMENFLCLLWVRVRTYFWVVMVPLILEANVEISWDRTSSLLAWNDLVGLSMNFTLPSHPNLGYHQVSNHFIPFESRIWVWCLIREPYMVPLRTWSINLFLKRSHLPRTIWRAVCNPLIENSFLTWISILWR